MDEGLIERAFVSEAAVEAAFRPAARLVAEARAVEDGAPSAPAALVRLVRLLGERGLLRLVLPGALGGPLPEVSSVALCLARERLAHASPLLDLAFAMQGLGSYPITLRGGDQAKARYLPRVGGGALVAAFALTEEGAGSDLSSIATTARKDGDGWVLEGEKVFISNAPVAELFTVFAATRPPGEPRRLSAFVVPATAAGLETQAQDVLGGHPIGRVRLRGVRVPAEDLLGAPGDGLSTALATLHRFRTTVGAAAVGLAQRALDETAAHVRTRVQFGAPLAALQAVQMRVAEMACDVEASRLLVYRAAALADACAGRTIEARAGSMAKLVATESAQRVIDHAVQLHGGLGVERRSTVARLYEEIRALRIYEGTSDVHKALIAREVLGA